MGFIIVFSAVSAYAASNPDVGWKRYDDKSPEISYLGTWLTETHSQYYGGFAKYSSTPKGQIKFLFTGTKLRIIGPLWENKPANMEIKIDGVPEIFSQYSAANYRTANVYEKIGLTEGTHMVEITIPSNVGSKNFQLDAIDIDEGGQLINVNVPTNLKATPGDSQVTLKWDKNENADSYKVKYGTESGKYTETATATKDVYGNFVIPGLTNGTKYYFIVSAKVNGVDSEYSNEASATPQGGGSQPDPEPTTGERAILVVTMTTGLEKEFDLSMKEVKDFISWYESKQAGSGSASYAINKHDNNKGPFSSRKDYMLYDRILTFEVSEYSK